MKTKTIKLTKEQLSDPKFIQEALLNAIEIKGTAVVRKPDGTISYKDPSKAGQFNEDILNDS